MQDYANLKIEEHPWVDEIDTGPIQIYKTTQIGNFFFGGGATQIS